MWNAVFFVFSAPKFPIFINKFINSKVIVTRADILVAKANPAICIFVNLTNSIFKVILSNIAIIPLIIGVFVSCNE